MAQIKICGITNEEDALCAARCGAAALGFIFYPSSPRYITPATALPIIRALPAGIVTVGVFVNEAAAEVRRIAGLCNLDFIQLHGDESVAYCRNFLPEMIIKAVELKNEDDWQKAASYDAAAILLDNRAGGLYGGTGQKADWNLALSIKKCKPLILSGGLDIENVKEAMEKVAPQALDINSGVEEKPGKKDHRKLAQLFAVARQVRQQKDNMPLIFTKRKL